MFPVILSRGVNSFVLLHVGSCDFRIVQSHHHQRSDEKGARNAILKETNIFKRVVLKQNNDVSIRVSRAFCETQPRLACICHCLELHHDFLHAGNHFREGFATPAALAVSSQDLCTSPKITRCKHLIAWNISNLHQTIFRKLPGEVKPKWAAAPHPFIRIVAWRALDSVLQPLQMYPKAARIFQGSSGNV